MRILMVCDSMCVRAMKIGLMLQAAGHFVAYTLRQVRNPSLHTSVRPQWPFGDPSQLYQMLEGLQGFDLIQVTSEPMDMAWHVRQHTDLPIVWDIHDLNAFRDSEPNEAEFKSVESADGYLCPSRYYHQHAGEVYGDKPSIVVYSQCNKFMLEGIDKAPVMGPVNGLVYEGGIGALPETPKERSMYGYRNFEDLFRGLSERGILVTVFGGNPRDAMTYESTGALVMPTLGYYPLLSQLKRFEAGFFGNLQHHPALDCSMPNKIWEYLAAGIPCVVMNARESGEWVEEWGAGISVGSIEELMDRWNELGDLKARVQAHRYDWIMERQIPKLNGFYEDIIDGRVQRAAGEPGVANSRERDLGVD